MKKILAILVAAVVALGASAQGPFAAGINVGVAPCLEKGASLTNFGIGAKLQYNISEPVRLEADFDYWFKAKGMSVFDVTLNGHYLVNCSEKFRIYPLVGVGYARWKAGVDNESLKEIDAAIAELRDQYGSYADEAIAELKAAKDASASCNRVVVNAGLGAEYSLTDNFIVNVEAKYQYMKNFSRLPITLGFAYKF